MWYGAAMSEPLRDRWTWDDYLAWEARQEVRHEFVDGEVRAMTGGTARHDVIGNRLRSRLEAAMAGQRCRVHGPDMKVATGNGNARYPDALLDCGRFVPEAVVAQEPTVLFEVLSRSTAWVDQGFKLRDYDATPSIRHYVLISQDEVRALIYTRDESGRLHVRNAVLVEGIEGVIRIDDPPFVLPLARLYEGVLA
jgi:Uma2 family endonuclease